MTGGLPPFSSKIRHCSSFFDCKWWSAVWLCVFDQFMCFAHIWQAANTIFCPTSDVSQVKTIASLHLYKLDLFPLSLLHYFTEVSEALWIRKYTFPPFLVYPLPHHEPDESGLLAWTGTWPFPARVVQTKWLPELESIKLFFHLNSGWHNHD